MPELAKRQRCSICKGVGLVKYDIVLCKYCEESKMPWDRCETCYGDGEVDIPNENQNVTKPTKRQRCSICNGVGLIKHDITLCKYSECGKMPWDRCETCYGDGEIDVPNKNDDK